MPSRWRTAPPSGNEFVPSRPETDAGWSGLGWAEPGRVKVEKERSDWTLRRSGGENRWGRGPLEADESISGEVAERSAAAAARLWNHSAEEVSAGRIRQPERLSVCGDGGGAFWPVRTEGTERARIRTHRGKTVATKKRESGRRSARREERLTKCNFTRFTERW